MNNISERQPCRVLIVDDHADTTDSYRLLCELWGHEVRHAFDAESALAQLSDFVPDVVLIDIGLPGMSGVELAAWLREDPRVSQARLIAITGYGARDGLGDAVRSHFTEFLHKPISIDTLHRVVERECVMAA